MARRRPTIARAMGWTAAFALNAALLRAFLLRDQFVGAVILVPSLQVAARLAARGRGRRRRFWLGGFAGGVGVALGLLWAEVDPGSPPGRLLAGYSDLAVGWFYRRAADPLAEWADEHWSLVMALIYGALELAGALLGALILAAMGRPRREGCGNQDESRP